MRDALTDLQYNKTPIQGTTVDTVGSQIRFAVGNISLGDQVRAYKEVMGTMDYDQILSEMTKSISSPGIMPITGDMSSYGRRLRERVNTIYLRMQTAEGGS